VWKERGNRRETAIRIASVWGENQTQVIWTWSRFFLYYLSCCVWVLCTLFITSKTQQSSKVLPQLAISKNFVVFWRQ